MKLTNELKAGIFLLIAIIIFVVSVWCLGQERQIFAKHLPLHLKFRDVQGLVEGAPVRLGGISIGHVAKIKFIEDKTPPTIKVSIVINADYQKYLSEDSKASIETQGLLGDKFLAIQPGSSLTPIKANAELQSEQPSDFKELMTKASNIVENVTDVSQNMNDVLVTLRDSSLKGLNKTLNNLAEITEQVKVGPSSIHSLLYSDSEENKFLSNLEATSENLKLISQEIKQGKGLIHSLIYDKNGSNSVNTITTAMDNIGESAEQLKVLLKSVEDENGLLHELIYGKSPKFDTLLKSLEDTANNLKKASEALAGGSGTLGALLIDSKLYDNLVTVTDEAKRSLILRYVVKSSLDKLNQHKKTDDLNSEQQINEH